MKGWAIGKHTGSIVSCQSPPWNSILPSLPDLLSTFPPATPWDCWSCSGGSPGCPWLPRSHGRASCGCCQNRPGQRKEVKLVGCWVFSPGQSSLRQLEERILLRRQQPPHHPAWGFRLQKYSRARCCQLPTLATMQANPLQSRWSALLLRSAEPSSAPAIPSSCLVQFTIGWGRGHHANKFLSFNWLVHSAL